MLVEQFQKEYIQVVQAPSDADLLIATSAVEAAKSKATVVIGEDTDLLILLVAYIENECKRVFFMSDTQKNS